ncbi:MAG: hypothetical protein KatS3mg105_4464 [Gemmatales bacterium]|nr:MAG: hypothetical protein KatS3mg105_4464 [Gemmatales bacterium]
MCFSFVRKNRWPVVLSGLFGIALGLSVWWLVAKRDSGDPRLRAFVYHLPPVPVVFTSRTEPCSLLAAAPEATGYTYPGTRLWAAREGRLRLLTEDGNVIELTWGKKLPDGQTLIDVMSPCVSPDGRRILFAGRKGGDDHGHFRLYEIGIDGSGLQQLTGGPEDAGCTALPPMRFGPDGQSLLPPDERRRIDYDDVDPVYLNTSGHAIAFVSSRIPDLGRNHSRRATTLWIMNGDGSQKKPITANRNNDRWPCLMASNYLAFSLWSRNPTVIAADERSVVPVTEVDGASVTKPPDIWMAAFRQTIGSQFGALVKARVPVWRPRPLFNGRIAFMTCSTASHEGNQSDNQLVYEVMQAPPGLIENVPSALPAGKKLPRQRSNNLYYGPRRDSEGRRLSVVTPGPCPDHFVLLSAAPVKNQNIVRPGDYALYLADDDWSKGAETFSSAENANLRLLFDDPDYVDSEPVAVYVRAIDDWSNVPKARPIRDAPNRLKMTDGEVYQGPLGQVFNADIYANEVRQVPGQWTDKGEHPIFDRPPVGSIEKIRFYASFRDRFDDPVRPRIPGIWREIIEQPVKEGAFGGWLPAGIPLVLAGVGADGRIVRWQTPAADSEGQSATFYAYAGDHYSSIPPQEGVFCIGCHPGHSTLASSEHRHAERLNPNRR